MQLHQGMKIYIKPSLVLGMESEKHGFNCIVDERLFNHRGEQVTVQATNVYRSVCHIRIDGEHDYKPTLYEVDWFTEEPEYEDIPVPKLFDRIYQPREKGRFAPTRCGAGDKKPC